MSAIAGCFWRDGRAACVDDLRVPTTAAAHRAGAPFRYFCSGAVALAVADDDPRNRSPLHDPGSRSTVILDGRLDNVDELAAVLDVPSDPCAVALAACRAWGADAGARLLGDFVILYHEQKDGGDRLTCIRDPMGLRPLFYGEGPSVFLLASETQQIVRHPSIRADINEGMVAEYLSDMPSTITETLWTNVHRVPPAHALDVDRRCARVRRYWDFDPDARVRHPDEDGYAEEFRDLFTRAVRCRVAGVEHVGVLLSGGIDSSAVAGVAQSVRAELSLAPVHALSATYPGRPCDETEYFEAVIEKWGLPATRVPVVLSSHDALVRETDRFLEPPMSPGRTADVLRQHAAQLQIRTLLTGCGGDDYFSGSPSGLWHMLRHGQVAGVARTLINPMLGDRARSILKPMFGGTPPIPPWIPGEFAKRTSLVDRLRALRVPSFPTREQRDVYGVVRALPQVLGDEMEDRAAHAAGVSQRHPFYDRRVAEFGLALPSHQRMRHGEHKIVIRRALRDVLPPKVAARSDKAEFSSTYVDTLAALGGERAFTEMHSAERGWVDGPLVADAYRRMIHLYSSGDESYIGLAMRIWTIAALDIWLDRIGSASVAT